jgi:SAM-dependent methyltransferase
MKNMPNILGAEVRMASRRVVALALLLLNFLPNAGAVSGQDPTSGAAAAEQRKTSEPYTGDLSVFDSPGRDERLQINRVMDVLGIAPGKSVADIGAGSGWFTVRAAKRIGADGRVYAVDINPEAVRYIGERVKKEQIQNVKTILSTADDPLLPAGSVDAVLLLKTYHEVAQPVLLLRNLRAALRPGAKVGVIDRNGNGEDHGVGRDIVIREAKEAGFELLKQYDFVKGDKMDYFLVFAAGK